MRILDAICVIGEAEHGGAVPRSILEQMRQNGVQRAVLVPDDLMTAVENEEGNRYVLDVVRQNPDAFCGFAVANPWFGKRAEQWLRAALDAGLCGVYFKSTVQGFPADDKRLNPLLEICRERAVPAYFHTGTPVHALPFGVLAQARRFPEVNFILGHMGANDYVGDAFAAVNISDNVYLETSLNLTTLIRSAAQLRPERVIFGSGSPRSNMAFELKKVFEAVPNEETRALLLHSNLERLLGGRV